MNNEKAFMARLSVRPIPRDPVLKGWRLTGFVTMDNYMQNAARNRYVLQTTYEHPYVNVGVDYLKTDDKASSALTNGVDLNPTLDGTGYSHLGDAEEGVRQRVLDRGAPPLRPHEAGRHGQRGTTITSPDGLNSRVIGGIAYWFPKKGGVSAALMFDVDNTTYSNWTPAKPTSRKFYVHTLISF